MTNSKIRGGGGGEWGVKDINKKKCYRGGGVVGLISHTQNCQIVYCIVNGSN